MTDRPVILPPDYLLSDEDILSDLYWQYASCVYLGQVYEALLKMAELTGSDPGKGVTWEAVWACRRLQAASYRLIEVLEHSDTAPGAAESAPELDLEQYKTSNAVDRRSSAQSDLSVDKASKGGNTTPAPKTAQRPSESPEDPFTGLGFTGFGDL